MDAVVSKHHVAGKTLRVLRHDRLPFGTKGLGHAGLVYALNLVATHPLTTTLLYSGSYVGYGPLAVAYAARLAGLRSALVLDVHPPGAAADSRKKAETSAQVRMAKQLGGEVRLVRDWGELKRVAASWAETPGVVWTPLGLVDAVFERALAAEVAAAYRAAGLHEFDGTVYIIGGSGLLARAVALSTEAQLAVVSVCPKRSARLADALRGFPRLRVVNRPKQAVKPPYPTVSSYDGYAWAAAVQRGKSGDVVHNVASGQFVDLRAVPAPEAEPADSPFALEVAQLGEFRSWAQAIAQELPCTSPESWVAGLLRRCAYVCAIGGVKFREFERPEFRRTLCRVAAEYGGVTADAACFVGELKPRALPALLCPLAAKYYSAIASEEVQRRLRGRWVGPPSAFAAAAAAVCLQHQYLGAPCALALPEAPRLYLEEVFGPAVELFATPVTASASSYFSLLPDVGAGFGGRGAPTRANLRAAIDGGESVFCAVPPRDALVLDTFAAVVLGELARARADGRALTFLVVLPDWDEPGSLHQLRTSNFVHAEAKLEDVPWVDYENLLAPAVRPSSPCIWLALLAGPPLATPSAVAEALRKSWA